jgi:hypothetical protein
MKLATKLTATLILLCAATAASANPFPDGNAQAGQKLFERFDCNKCHNQIMKGDGNKIFTRFDRSVKSPDGLISQIGMCSGNVNTHFSPKETQDLAAYLNIFYKFK